MPGIHLGTAGGFSALFDAENLGYTEEGHHLDIIQKGEVVKFEEFADAQIDFINRGKEIFIDVILKEWNAPALLNLIWPFSDTFGKEDCLGQFANQGASPNAAAPLVLTARGCSPAADTSGENISGATITFHRASITPEVAKRINLNNKLRVVPVRFTVFLTDVSDTSTPDLRYFTES